MSEQKTGPQQPSRKNPRPQQPSQQEQGRSRRNKRPNRRPERYSPTAINAFRTCPKQYEFQYIERVEVDEAASPHLIFGNALHQALAYLYRLDPALRTENVACLALRHFWARADRAGAFLNDQEEAAWGQKALAALRVYCGRYDLAIIPLAVEEWIRAELPNGRIVFGKADRVDRARGKDAGIEVIDYKSGRCRIEDDELGQDQAARLYALAATRTFRQPVVRVRFLYICDGIERRWSPEAEDLTAVENELMELTEQISATSSFEARPADHCRWCRYRSLCPAAGQASLAELDSEPETVF